MKHTKPFAINKQLLNPLTLTGQSEQHIHWLTNRIGIHKKMVLAWQALQKAALKAKLQLEIASGFRDFNRQLTIWNNKFTQKTATKDINNQVIDFTNLSIDERIKAILLYSALPGASRHHWGTDIDIYATNLLASEQSLQLEPWEYHDNGPMAELSHWLGEHSQDFGFYFPYDKYRGGVCPEPWHLSYFPIAEHYAAQFNENLLHDTLAQSNIAGQKNILKQLPFIYKNFIINVNQP